MIALCCGGAPIRRSWHGLPTVRLLCAGAPSHLLQAPWSQRPVPFGERILEILRETLKAAPKAKDGTVRSNAGGLTPKEIMAKLKEQGAPISKSKFAKIINELLKSRDVTMPRRADKRTTFRISPHRTKKEL